MHITQNILHACLFLHTYRPTSQEWASMQWDGGEGRRGRMGAPQNNVAVFFPTQSLHFCLSSTMIAIQPLILALWVCLMCETQLVWWHVRVHPPSAVVCIQSDLCKKQGNLHMVFYKLLLTSAYLESRPRAVVSNPRDHTTRLVEEALTIRSTTNDCIEQGYWPFCVLGMIVWVALMTLAILYYMHLCLEFY